MPRSIKAILFCKYITALGLVAIGASIVYNIVIGRWINLCFNAPIFVLNLWLYIDAHENLIQARREEEEKNKQSKAIFGR